MLWIYNIGILLYGFLARISSPFNPKAKQFIEGRKDIWKCIESRISKDERPIWFHFASLGEFEQGRPVLEALKKKPNDPKIIVTFFSPSGYEIRKDYAFADVFYLPLDTASNAKKFIAIVNPSIAIFTKYEFWYHYFKELHESNTPLYLISGIFRPTQVFFKWYGGFYRNLLKFVTHFFVQNEESVSLLKSIGLANVSLGGDTRFDRVYENAISPKKLPIVEQFCSNSKVFIAGSTWLPDEQILAQLVKEYTDWKFIIAPHEIHPNHIHEIVSLYPTANLYSDLANTTNNDKTYKTSDSNVLVIDNIGMLSSLYQYARVAYIGGGFGTGIHNTLEAAAFGVPIIFGPKYDKFQEAKDLIANGAAVSINDELDLANAFEHFKDNSLASASAKKYVVDKKGATNFILEKIKL